MTIYYLLPVIAIVLVVVVAKLGRSFALANARHPSLEEARTKMNQYFADDFELHPGETLFACWVGEEYQGDASTASQVAGAALNRLSRAAIGVSSYVPSVRIAITSLGRVLIAREYGELGDRGNFKQIYAFAPGTRALDAGTARPGQVVKPPLSNALGQVAPPEFVQFRAPSGEFYEAWMLGGQTQGSFVHAFHTTSNEAANAPSPVAGYARAQSASG